MRIKLYFLSLLVVKQRRSSGNVLSSDTHVFGNATTLYGHSPFRELQLLIDGQLAGVAWPFPVIFTGGIVPGFWRPIVGIDAFDLREDEIDISPFIPLLTDGNSHTFEIRIVGVDDDGHGNGNFTENIESNWVVTGKLFIWLGTGPNTTTTTLPTIYAPTPSLRLYSITHPNSDGTVNALEYSIEVSRHVHIQSIVHSPLGPKTLSWMQNLTYSNSGTISNQGNYQLSRQTTSGTCSSSSGYIRSYEYPLSVTSSYDAPSNGNITIYGEMQRGKNVQQTGDLAFLNDWRTFDRSRLQSMLNSWFFRGTNIKSTQNGTASYLSIPAQKRSYSSGSTEQLFTLSGINQGPIAVVQDGTNRPREVGQTDEDLYQRHIVAANDSIVLDEEKYGGQRVERSRISFQNQWVFRDNMHEHASRGVRAILGRGPY
jgi:hypothetical protein